MSSIRSASSNTKYVHRRKLVVPRSRKSIRRPGVAITISTPRSKSRACNQSKTPRLWRVTKLYTVHIHTTIEEGDFVSPVAITASENQGLAI